MSVSSVPCKPTVPDSGLGVRARVENSVSLPAQSIFRNNFLANGIVNDWGFGRNLVSGPESSVLVKGVGVLCGTTCVVVGVAARLTGVAYLFSCVKDVMTRIFNWISGKIYDTFLDSFALYHTKKNKAVERLLDSVANDVVNSLESMANGNGRSIQFDKKEAKAALSELILKKVLTTDNAKSEPILKEILEENLGYIDSLKQNANPEDPDSMLRAGVANVATAVAIGYAQPGDKAGNVVAALELNQVVERLKPAADQLVGHVIDQAADKAKERAPLLGSLLIKDVKSPDSSDPDDNVSSASSLELNNIIEQLKPAADQLIDHAVDRAADKAKERAPFLGRLLIKDAEPSEPSMSPGSNDNGSFELHQEVDDNGSRQNRESVCTRVTNYFSGLPGRAMSPFFNMMFMPPGYAED